MGKRKKTDRAFLESAALNTLTYDFYYQRILELFLSRFEWKNLPDTVDPRFIELVLFEAGQAIFFKEDVLQDYLCLRCAPQGDFDVYGVPKIRGAYSFDYNNNDLTKDNSVIIYNNLTRTNDILMCQLYARKLYNLDRTFDVNMNAQKTPVLMTCDETQRLTILNVYKQWDGNAPVIFGGKNLDLRGITVLKTDAPFLGDKLLEAKTAIWNEVLTYLGISNIAIQKKERMVTDEVTRTQGGVVSSKYSALAARQQACEQINRLFGLDISCEFRQDIKTENIEGEGVNTDE